ncbi:MAG TPA: hypothetical protein PKA00_00605 [Saprospiraceae bacterium]|nr:hypothetical protein [Saprospiraceae bacterium]HMQ81365.1 hypothetical protein [Saprospiraceae bacterium]
MRFPLCLTGKSYTSSLAIIHVPRCVILRKKQPIIDIRKYPINLYRVLQVAAIAVFLGRAWQHLFLDAPFRTLFWEERWMKWPVENLLGMSWRTYVTSPQTDQFITNWVVATGVLYFLSALACLFVKHWGRVAAVLIWAGAINLMLLAALYCKENFFFTGQFFEYSLQFSAPIIFLSYVRKNGHFSSRAIFWIKLLTALTFTCHGLYAVGFYPRPGQFVVMTMNILHVDEHFAARFLLLAGYMDFVISFLLFFPRRWAIAAALYATFWGFLTTVARVWAFFHWEYWENSLRLWLHESLYRFPHFLIPMFLVWYLASKYDKNDKPAIPLASK